MAHGNAPIRQLIWGLILTGAIFLLQLVGALTSGSLSLLSNAGHLFTDIGALGLALYAAKMEQNLPTNDMSYGYRRGGIVAAFINGLVLMAVGLALLISSLYRLWRPTPVNATVMLYVTAATLVLNVLVTVILHPRHAGHDLNRWGVYWHALGDALSSVGILIAALLIAWTHWTGWDALAAMAVGLFILWTSLKVSRPSVRILMEATPDGTRVEDLYQTFLSHPAVTDVHHLHVWSISPEYRALSAHVRLETLSIREGQHIIEELAQTLEHQHRIHHITIQLEADQHEPSDH